MKKYFAIAILLLVLVACQNESAQPSPTADVVAEVPEPVVQAVEDVAEVIQNTVTDVAQEIKDSFSGTEMKILGREGFDVDQLTIKAGDSVNFVNGATQATVVNIQGPTSINTKLLRLDDSEEVTFSKAGTYKILAVSLGLKAQIIVE
jgi:plastocyanin